MEIVNYALLANTHPVQAHQTAVFARVVVKRMQIRQVVIFAKLVIIHQMVVRANHADLVNIPLVSGHVIVLLADLELK